MIIASTQLQDFFGLKIDKVPEEFLARIQSVVHNFSSFSPVETTLAVGALAVIIVFMRYVKRVPGYSIALFLGTVAVLLFKLPAETIGTRFGGIPSGLPTLKVPHLRLDLLWSKNSSQSLPSKYSLLFAHCSLLIALCSAPFEDKAGPGGLLPGEIPGILNICDYMCREPIVRCPVDFYAASLS